MSSSDCRQQEGVEPHVRSILEDDPQLQMSKHLSGAFEDLEVWDRHPGQPRPPGGGCGTTTHPRRARVLQVYAGHRNQNTVKGVFYMGPRDEYVVSGSDCGHLFIWETQTGVLVNMAKADQHIVNCVAVHPSYGTLVSSGIEDDVKVWDPVEPNKAPPTVAFANVIERNLRRH